MPVRHYEPFNDIRKGFDLVTAIINSVEEQTTKEKSSEDSTAESTQEVVLGFTPKVNMRETEEIYTVEVELPGVLKENTKIEVDGETLIVSGERVLKDEAKEEEYRKVESDYGKFSRAFTLPKRVDTSKIEATFELGILEVSIPKKELLDTSKIIKIK